VHFCKTTLGCTFNMAMVQYSKAESKPWNAAIAFTTSCVVPKLGAVFDRFEECGTVVFRAPALLRDK